MRTLIRNIKKLYGITETSLTKKSGAEMQQFSFIENAWLLIENKRILDFGTMPEAGQQQPAMDTDKVIDASGKMVLPAFVDSHTHLVFPASREEEFVMKIQGKSYEEIAAAGGGILNSANKLALTGEDALFDSAVNRLQEVIAKGTGALEIKSGYGLSLEGELKMLRVIKKLKEISPTPIRATFLGAHAIPTAFKNDRQGYINQLLNEMLPNIAAEGLADFIDVFCEKGFFSPEETLQIIEAGAKYDLPAKIHANQMGLSGGVQAAVAGNALSADHLEHLSEVEINLLKNARTMPVALPNCSLFLRMPYTPARAIIQAGLPLALASDYNPGSAPSGDMRMVISLACIQMKMMPEEAFNAATINGAYALNWSHDLGSITKGKLANLIITKPIPSLQWIPYAFTSEWIDKVMINGY